MKRYSKPETIVPQKRRLRDDLVLTHKVLYNQIDLEATQLFKLSRSPGLRSLSLRLPHQTGRTRRRRNSFACRVAKYWNRLPLTVSSVPEQRTFKKTTWLIYLPIMFVLYSIFAPIWSFWTIYPFSIIKYLQECIPMHQCSYFDPCNSPESH